MIVDSHIPHDVMSRFLQGDASKGERRWATRHLLSGCERCHGLAQQVISSLSGAGRLQDEGNYTRAIQSMFSSYLAIERQRRREVIDAPALWAKLKAHPPEQREIYIRASRRFATWGFFDHLIAEAWAARHANPREAVAIASLALTLTDFLPEEEFSESLRFTLKAEAYTALGNYTRIIEDFPAAIGYLDKAEECLEMGTGEIVTEGRMLSVRSSVLCDIGNFEEGASCAMASIRLFQSIGESQLEAREWVTLSSILKFTSPQEGVRAAEYGLHTAEPSDRQLITLAHLAKIDCMVECGYGPAALAEFHRIQGFVYDVPGRRHRTNVKFLAGRIAAAVDRQKEAMRLFLEAIDDYRSLELYQEMSIAQLSLVWLLIDRRKWRKAIQLAESTIHHFERMGLRRDVLAVWLTIRDLLARESVEARAARNRDGCPLLEGWSS